MKKILPVFQLFFFKNVFNATFLMFLSTLPINVSANSEETSVNTKLLGLSSSNWRVEASESEYFNNNNVINNNNNANNKPSEKNEGISEFVFTPATLENSETHVPALLPAKSTYGVVVFKKKRSLIYVNSKGVGLTKNKEQEKLKAKQTFMEIAKPAPYQTKQSLNINLSVNSSSASSGNATITSTNQKKLSSEKDLKKLIEKNRKLNLLRFTENKGQVRDQNENPRPDVLFYGQDGKMGFHIKNNGISYQLYKITKWKKADFGEKFKHENTELPDEYSLYRVDLNWLNSNSKAQWHSLDAHEDVANFYNVPNSDGVTNVNSYSELMCQNLYDGINLKYYEFEGGLKHDYIVSPGADYKLIQVEIKGAKPILNAEGHLFLETSQGKIQEFKPRAFQNGSEVAVKYIISGNVLSYAIENYDSKIELIIDPLTRLWGTYYGGTSTEYGRAVDTDASGNVLMAGYTLSSGLNIISTSGSHQVNIGGGWDAFVAKFNTAGVRQWATYYGGSSTDYGYGVCSDAANNVFMTGYTTSNNNIASVGAHKAVYNSADAFLVKFNSAGVRQWGTYYGGTSTEEGYAVDTDASGDVYMVGYTSGSITDVATPGSHDDISNGTDAFLVKFNTSGVRQWATYYGGASTDYGYWVCVDNQANVYITGYTFSSDAISTPGSHQATYIGTDAFLAKFNSAGVRQWGTYYGGTSTEYGQGVCVDAANNVFLAGYTSGSATDIASVGAHDAIVNGGDAFLAKFDFAGVRLWGTYYGGTSTDYGYGVTTNPSTGHSFLTGYTSSFADIATVGSHDATLAGTDAFIAEFNPSGVRQWGSYYGGTSTEYGYSICSDNAGNVFLAGYTFSFADIATVGSHDNVQDSDDAFLVKWQNCIGPAAALNTTSIYNLQRCVNQTAPLSASGSGTIRWFATLTSTITLATGGNYTTPALTPAGVYTYYVTGDNACSQSFPRTAVTVTAITSPTITLNNQNICSGGSATLIPSGGITYTWSTSATTPSIVVSPVVNTVYTVQAGVTGCIGTQTAMVTVSVQPVAPVITPSVLSTVCGGTAAPTFTASGSTGIYAWFNAINGPVISTNTIYTTPTLSSSATYYLAASAATLQASVGTYTFTNASAIGNIGPTQAQINTAYAASNLNGLVTITGQGIQNFTVPATGVYRIRARGAQGGFSGGLGAIMEGDFTLNAGEIIRIIVGQQGTGSGPGAGGGGSFVVRAPYTTTNSILVIAGGGSGGGNYATSPGLTIANGGFGGVAGGTNGTGGLGGSRGAGGGGFLTNGAFSSLSALYANPGIAFVNGGQGGAPTNNCGFNGAGGFGGGSSHGGNCFPNGGAGGGFSGGGGSSNSPSGGGGSLNNGTSQTNQQGVNSGNGLVIIQPISVSSVAGCTSVKVPITINIGPATPTISVSNQTICTAQSATLIASGATTYTWNTNATTSSIVVTPVVNTTYTVSSGIAPCAAQKTVAVTVTVQPSSPAVTPSSAAVCGTAAPTFTASGSSGIYAWYSAINGPVVGTGSVFTTPTLTNTSTYYLAAAISSVSSAGQTYTFTNAAATGSLGPTQLQVNTAYSATNLNNSVTVNPQGIQTFTVPQTGTYRIRAAGASANNGASANFGIKGRIIQQDITLNAGDVLKIAIGQMGTIGSGGSSGGGGGSFVSRVVGASTVPIIVAGGGGGQYSPLTATVVNSNGSILQAGFNGIDNSGVGGAGGNGGTGSSNGWGGGGSGFNTNGTAAANCALTGGSSFLNNANGGNTCNDAPGGFGGGGGTHGNSGGGGGGGGYSGGGGCNQSLSGTNAGGGGGSFFNASATNTLDVGFNIGAGYAIVQAIAIAAPATCQSALVPITINVGPATPTITANNYTACIGGTLNIAAISTAGTYTWSNGPTTSSFTNTPLSSTVYTVSSGSSPCIASATVGVFATAQPVVPTISPASTTLCGSGSATLTASGSSGNYAWLTSPSGPIISLGSSLVTPTLISSSTYYVQAYSGTILPAATYTFNFTGALQTWVVPSGVTQVTLTLNGAKGVDSPAAPTNTAGMGGRVTCVYPVTPGQTLNLYVGGSTGYNGGGIGSATYGGTGGGASDIRIGGTALANRVIVAGGGGGGGFNCSVQNWGGGGGGLTGVSGFQCNTPGTYATGGTQLVGGTGIGPGTLGQGGNGANTYGGGGGGGYYGGGGAAYGGGGGGSSFTNASALSVVHTQSVNAGNGTILITVPAVNLACNSTQTLSSITVGPATPTISVSNQTICTAQSATLIASGATTYTWNTNATTSSIVVTPTVATTYTVVSGFGPCAAQKTVAVTVTVQPSSPAVTPSFAAVCGSIAPTFTASGSSGIYAWYNAINGPVVGTGSVFTTPTLTNTSTFYLAAATSSVSSAGQTYTFTNAAATGSLGPTQLQVNTAYSATNLNNSVTVNPQGIQTFTVPQTGTYRIRAAGASANNGASTNFGIKGRIIQQDITLNAGDVLKIAIGQMGTVVGAGSSGGGGGSFVARVVGASTVPIIVAGGGGGYYLALTATVANSNGSILQAGFNGIDNTGVGGAGGNGGTGASGGWGGGGGGFNTNGTAASACALTGGSSFLNNGNGGNTCNNSPGGFGGGGGTHGNTGGGGGGGGYSGGGGCGQSLGGTNAGGGGGSFFNASATNTLDVGFNIGAGYAIVQAIAIAAPATCQSALVPITVTVGPAQPTITANNQTICANQSATLQASGATTYTWNTNATTPSIVVTPTVATTYTVSSGFGPCAAQKTVAVNVIPIPTTPIVTPNNFTLCSNSNSILTAASNATVFAWSTTPNGPAFATTPTLAVSGLTANTTYYVAAAAGTAAASGSLTFNHTGSSQVFTVPQGVTSVTVRAWGAEGGGSALSGNSSSGFGGKGGYAAGILTVTPGSTLQINVGGFGLSSVNGLAVGGFNGGGSGYASSAGEPGNGGGGASDVRVGGTAFNNRVIVAGGGGGGGEDTGDQYGDGGGLTGVNYPGYDATQTAAGPGGGFGFGGTTGQGDGGGGGGGWYGGGTLSSNSIGTDTQGGGGGSGYIVGVTAGTLIAGNASMPSFSVGTMIGNTGHGKLIISWSGNGNLCATPFATVNIVGQVGPTVTVSNSQTICSTQSATLTASGAPNYLWSTSSTASSIVVSPASTTIYTVTGGSAACADQKTVGVNVLPTPSTPIVTPNNFTLCSNSNSILTAASNATVFAWSTTPNGPAFATTPTLAVSGLTANTTYYVAAAAGTAAASGSLSFNHTGSSQVFTVPQGVTSVTVQAWGAKGGNGLLQGGNGGAVSGVLSVVPGTTIQINVGGQGSVTAGGFNGGGNGGIGSSSSGSGGGGASDIRINGTTLANRVLVAAGGGGVGGTATTYNAAAGIGGSGANCAAPFGVGGSAANGCGVGNIGTCAGGTAPSYGTGGGGGGLNSGGALAGSGGGSFGQGGSLGQGGGGGNNAATYGGSGGGVNGGGGGGGGYFGGAGGMSGNGGCNGGGGGGSSYANNAILTNVTFTGGISAGQGSVILSWSGNGNLCATPFATVNIVGQVGPTVTVSNSQTICSTQSATLTASGAPNYLWSTSSTASSIVVSPASTTIYTVTGGSAACADQKTVGVNVLPIPSTPVVTPNNFTLCSNINTVLTAASNATAYAWYTVPNGSIIANTSTLAVANLTTNATYYVLAAAASAAASGSLAFNFTGSSQSWTVPPGVTVITTTLNGAQGGTGSKIGANGGRVICNYNVTPGQVLNIFVGGQGGPMGNNAAGGFNGGGNAGGATGPTYAGSGGGGASDIRVGGVALANRIIVAGGGGGANNINGFPGVGGGLTGGNVGSTGNGCITTYATGGSQLAGGNACVGSASCCFFTPSPIVATLGIGGNGSGPATSCNSGDGGGGGGGGYYGGGGGGSYSSGAGGSSYTGPGASGVVHTQGVNAGNGSVNISWIGSGNLCPSPLATVNISALQGPTVTAAASNTYLCTGTLTSVLSATGATSYTWFPLNVNTNTVAVTPSLSTIYTVQGQNPNGCIDTKTVFIAACSFLPVQLLSFEALKNSNVVDLIWVTQSELNCDKFHIEKTLDFNSWKFVCEVKGSGNSTTRKSYMCKDINPVNGINYYRLKQIDFNGSVNYSPIRQVKFDAEGNELLEVIPNPNDGNFVVIFDVEMNSETKIELTDAFGRIISESMSFKENFTGSKQIEMNISSLAAGVYFVNKITPNGIKKSKKVIKAY